MEAFINNFGGYIAITTLIVAGAVAVYGLWDKSSRERRKQVDGEEDRLIDILNKTVKELEKKVDKQDRDIRELTKKVDELEQENNTLLRVLQGRDEQTQEFYKQGFHTMKVSAETHEMVKAIYDTHRDTNENIKKLIELMSKHADIIAETTKAKTSGTIKS